MNYFKSKGTYKAVYFRLWFLHFSIVVAGWRKSRETQSREEGEGVEATEILKFNRHKSNTENAPASCACLEVCRA